MVDRQHYIRILLDRGIVIDAALRLTLADKFSCKPRDIASEVYRIRNPRYYDAYYVTHQVASENGRAKKLGIAGHIYPDDWRALCQQYEHRCLACGEPKRLVIDHVIPLSRGGAHDISNVQPLCWDCNSRKKTEATDYR